MQPLRTGAMVYDTIGYGLGHPLAGVYRKAEALPPPHPLLRHSRKAD
jgi:hypothetical protein